jgi:hypothetical protein
MGREPIRWLRILDEERAENVPRSELERVLAGLE